MNFVKFLRTPFFTEHLRWLLLKTDATNLVVLPLSSEDEDKKLTQTIQLMNLQFTIYDLHKLTLKSLGGMVNLTTPPVVFRKI